MDREILEELRQIISHMLDIEIKDITSDTYIVRELGAESIDMLELSLSIGSRFDIKVDEDLMFLKRVAFCKREADQKGFEKASYLGGVYPFLSKKRLEEIASDTEGISSPVKVCDLVDYITWKRNNV